MGSVKNYIKGRVLFRCFGGWEIELLVRTDSAFDTYTLGGECAHHFCGSENETDMLFFLALLTTITDTNWF